MSSSEPGNNIHDAFDDDSENIGMLDGTPTAAGDGFVQMARAAHRREQGEAYLADLRANLPTIAGGPSDGAPVIGPDLTLMMAFTLLDGMSYVQIPDAGRMPIAVAAKNLRWLADMLEGKEVARICGACAGDIDAAGRCPSCTAAAEVTLDPLDDEQQPPAPMEPCS